MHNPLYDEIYILIGRFFFSLFFIISGLNHLMNLERMAGYVRQKHLPVPKLIVAFTGTAILFGGLTVLVGLWVKAGTIILALFLVATAFLFHDFWEREDPADKSNAMNHFLKDIALAGASLMLWHFGTGPLSLGN